MENFGISKQVIFNLCFGAMACAFELLEETLHDRHMWLEQFLLRHFPVEKEDLLCQKLPMWLIRNFLDFTSSMYMCYTMPQYAAGCPKIPVLLIIQTLKKNKTLWSYSPSRTTRSELPGQQCLRFANMGTSKVAGRNDLGLFQLAKMFKIMFVFPHIFVWDFLFVVGHSRACSSHAPAAPPAACSHTRLTHTHTTRSHTTCPHTTYSHTTCSHITYSHATCSHTTCSHTTCPHTTCPHTSYSQTRTHTTYSHTTCPHTTCLHTTSPNTHTHSLLTHNLSTHNLSTYHFPKHTHTHSLLTHNLSTHSLSTYHFPTHNFTHTQLGHTQLTHTQLAHT